MSDGSVYFATVRAQVAVQLAIADRLARKARLAHLARKLGRGTAEISSAPRPTIARGIA
jgi:hypothetical protein